MHAYTMHARTRRGETTRDDARRDGARGDWRRLAMGSTQDVCAGGRDAARQPSTVAPTISSLRSPRIHTRAHARPSSSPPQSPSPSAAHVQPKPPAPLSKALSVAALAPQRLRSNSHATSGVSDVPVTSPDRARPTAAGLPQPNRRAYANARSLAARA